MNWIDGETVPVKSRDLEFVFRNCERSVPPDDVVNTVLVQEFVVLPAPTPDCVAGGYPPALGVVPVEDHFRSVHRISISVVFA